MGLILTAQSHQPARAETLQAIYRALTLGQKKYRNIAIEVIYKVYEQPLTRIKSVHRTNAT